MEVVKNDILLQKFSNDTKKLTNEIKSINKEKKLRKVCEDFESLFLNYMFQEMRKTVPKYDLIKKTNAMKIYESMKYENLAKELSHSGGIGIADMLYDNLKQEIFSK
jgi:flagellar protein FlgJ